ncbi:MAG: hypothetical protein IPL73_29395 [Candidatus Obscuribacter sp.]|nr:hypothetical protein [Candidatus Obscuribacter sp.]
MVANKRLSLLITTSTLGLSLIFCLSGCQTIKIGGKANPGQTGQTSSGNADVSGPWQISFEVNKEPMSAHINLQQSGNSFQGTGTDDKDNQNFVIDAGVLNGKSLRFHKRYHVDENPNLPPIVYTGVFDVVNTPNTVVLIYLAITPPQKADNSRLQVPGTAAKKEQGQVLHPCNKLARHSRNKLQTSTPTFQANGTLATNLNLKQSIRACISNKTTRKSAVMVSIKTAKRPLL